MKKQIANYTIIDCTAIAITAGDTDRQDAILAIDNRYDFDNKSILFGYSTDMIDCEDDLAQADTWSMDEDDLATVVIERS